MTKKMMKRTRTKKRTRLADRFDGQNTPLTCVLFQKLCRYVAIVHVAAPELGFKISP